MQRPRGAGKRGPGIAIARFCIQCIQIPFSRNQRLTATFNQGAAHGMCRWHGLNGGKPIWQRANGHSAQGAYAGPSLQRNGGRQGRYIISGRKQKRYGKALHIKRCHHLGWADQPFDPRAQCRLRQFFRQNCHFQRGCAAQIVQQGHMIATARVGGQTVQHHRHRRLGTGEINLADTRLAVNAKAQFGLPCTNAVFLG